VQSAAIQSVALRALQMADQASAMAQRGMLYSARTELIQALQLIIQALDVQERDSRHAAALAAGLAALDEARDFSAKSARPGESVNVSTVATSHRTPVLKGEGNTITSPVVAQQQYFAYAQTQLVAAAGGVPAASQILYRLGRLQTVMALHDVDPLALHAPQAIVFHQSSLVTDGGNYQAANELGVLLARYGQLPEARRLLILSVSTRPQVETWQNLSVVHRRLGEFDLAVRADHERQLLAKQLEQAADSSSDMIRWVDPQTFAASGGPEVPVPALTATKPAATPTAARR
jgi:tetratricopeptide (TPR) repeat protein